MARRELRPIPVLHASVRTRRLLVSGKSARVGVQSGNCLHAVRLGKEAVSGRAGDAEDHERGVLIGRVPKVFAEVAVVVRVPVLGDAGRVDEGASVYKGC